MEPSLVVLMTVAVALQIVLYRLFGRFIEPQWKVLPKAGFYLLITWIIASAVGWWSLVWIVGHPRLGILAHAVWCGRYGIDWMTCEPRDEYLRHRPWAASTDFVRVE